MPVFCLGVSHRTAPVELRERFALTTDAIPPALQRLRDAGLATEAVWLSTCNRVEIYLNGAPDSAPALQRWMIDHAGAAQEGSADSLYVLPEPASVEHLFRVASGLDSMVLGETEILGQLKKAYELAQKAGHTGARLNKAFQRAFNVAKHIRSTTAIQRGNVSVASVSVELAERLFEKFDGRRALLIGAGDTGEKVARAFVSRGISSVRIHNRSPDKAAALAEALGPLAQPCTDWLAEAPGADVIVSSTSTPGFVIDPVNLEPLLPLRHHRTILLIDLAVPRDIDPAVAHLPDVYLYNVDDLQMIASHHLQQREAEVAKCNAIIREKARALLDVDGPLRHPMSGTLPSPA